MQAFTVPAVDRFFTFTDLEHSTEYLIQIQAVNGFGGGEFLQLVVQTGEQNSIWFQCHLSVHIIYVQ